MFLRRRQGRDRRVLRKKVLEALSTSKTALIYVRRSIAYIESFGGKGDSVSTSMLESLYMLEYVLEAVITRLETMLILEDASHNLASAPLRLVREALNRSAALPPEVAGYLRELEALIASIAPGSDESILMQALSEEPKDPLAERLIVEAEEAAKTKVKKRLKLGSLENPSTE